MSGVELRVPDLGEGLLELTLVRWLVGVGDQVALDQSLCEVETDKATVEIPAPAAGTIARLGGATGDTLPVGALLVEIETAPSVPGTTGPPTSAGGAGGAPGPELVGSGAELAPPPLRRRRPAVGPMGAAPSAPQPPRPAPPSAPAGEWELVPIDGVRRAVAERMARAQREVPMASASLLVDVTALLAAADRLGGDADRSGAPTRVTPFALVLWATATTLLRHPELNGTVEEGGGAVRRYRDVHLGVAVDTPHGLIVPVLRDAARRTIPEVADELVLLAEGARSRRLRADRVGGATFTVTDHGVFDTDDGHPIVMVPQIAILAVGAIRVRPVVADGQVVARPTMVLTCVFDHRACDGAAVGRFLADLRRLLEAPALEPPAG